MSERTLNYILLIVLLAISGLAGYTYYLRFVHDGEVGDGTSVSDTTGLPGSGTTVYGYVFDQDGQSCSDSSSLCPNDWNLTLNGGSQISDNPYYFTGLMDGDYEILMNYSGNFEAYYSICEGCLDHHENSYQKGDNLSLTLASQGYVSLYWKFLPSETTSESDETEDIVPDIYLHEDGTVTCGNIDSNEDGALTIIDFKAFVKVYAKSCSESTTSSTAQEYVCGSQDTNEDGKIDIVDFLSFKKRYGLDDCSL